MKQDIYQKVTDKIIADLEQGELTWHKPWSAGNMDGRIIKPLRHNGMPYNGINVLMLWGAAMEGGYLSPFWMTYRQAKDWARMCARASAAIWSFMPTPSPRPKSKTMAARKSGKSRS